MSIEGMDAISGKMKKNYLKVERVLSKRQKGFLSVLEAQICVIFGLCPRTSHEYMNLFSSLGIVTIYKDKFDKVVWKHNPNISINGLLMEFGDSEEIPDDSGITPSSEESSSEESIDEANRLKFRAPQE